MKIKPATDQDRRDIEEANASLRVARKKLRRAGAMKAAAAVSRALKSAEGALRHVNRRIWACKVCGRAPWAHAEPGLMCRVAS